MKTATAPLSDYGSVITAEDYVSGINEHPDIPQSDAGICRMIENHARLHEDLRYYVLELGCGPGRLTPMLLQAARRGRRGKEAGVHVLGIDQSASFIENTEWQSGLDYVCEDFLEYTPHPNVDYDAIVLQGVMHHVPEDLKQTWLLKCCQLLRPKGILIIGDEFIPPYNHDEERKSNAAGLYAYVIASALRAGNVALADIEVQNMIDDVGSGSPGAGHATPELVAAIKKASADIYKWAHVSIARSKELQAILAKDISDFATSYRGDDPSSDRGDRKVSIHCLESELMKAGFELRSLALYGPVEFLGGMAVLECLPCS